MAEQTRDRATLVIPPVCCHCAQISVGCVGEVSLKLDSRWQFSCGFSVLGGAAIVRELLRNPIVKRSSCDLFNFPVRFTLAKE